MFCKVSDTPFRFHDIFIFQNFSFNSQRLLQFVFDLINYCVFLVRMDKSLIRLNAAENTPK